MKNQKAFIQIPILIIIIALIIIASVGTGVILYRQGKLAPLVADISEVFKDRKGTPPAWETEIQSEKPQLTEEAITQLETNQQEISRQNQELKKTEMEVEARPEEKIEEKRLSVPKEENRPPQITLFWDNVVGSQDLTKERGDNIFSCRFGIPEGQVQIPVKDYEEIIKNYSIKVGDTLTIKIDGYDPEGDTILYNVTYFEGQGTTRILQEWNPNNTFTIPITDQLFEKLFTPEIPSGVNYSTERREGDLIIIENYRGSVIFRNGGILRVTICYNEAPAQMDLVRSGSQCMRGCIRINYFLVKPGLSYYESHYEQKY